MHRLLEGGFDFTRTLDDPALVAVSGASVLERLAVVRPSWTLHTFDRVEPVTIDGKMVLTRRRLLPRRMWGGRR